MEFVVEQPSGTHVLSSFNCGRPEMDRWLTGHAIDAAMRRTARTFVWHRGDGIVIAYYSLTAHLIQQDDLPRWLGRGSPRQIPAVLLARLALHVDLHGRQLGGALLAEALARVLAATDTVAARFVVVDAIDQTAAEFYSHYGFNQIPGTLRLVQKISDIAAALQ